ncbi:RDD family protein [Paenibacillus ehimensis]|uniref:RDD family protein n=1 Tax=Paenibacillus ehimensis TaxID=79264 RepID=UPI000FD85ABC|nr:RDD family protein [Paenibacillus ehimensis]
MNEVNIREASIVTPEHVRLQFRTAGIGSRTAAQLVDNLLLLIAFGAISLLIGLILMLLDIGLDDALGEYAAAFLIVLSFLLIGGYYALTEYYMGGQTFGKKWLGLRVIQENGQPVTLLSAIIRNFFRLIDFLPSFYFVGMLWMFFHPMDKRLGDLAAGTLVIRDLQHERLHLRKRTQKWLAKHRIRLPYELKLSEAFRRRIEREDWLLLSTFVERLPSLDKFKREELARQVAERLGTKLELERELYAAQSTAFLIELYVQLSEEWSL